MTQKLLKVGDSTAVTIPKKSLDELGLKAGDRVIVEVDKENQTVKIKPAVKIGEKGVRYLFLVSAHQYQNNTA